MTIALAYTLPPRFRFHTLGTHLRTYGNVHLFSLLLANAPDLDYIPGIMIGHLNAFHHTYTHTLGFLVLVSVTLYCCS